MSDPTSHWVSRCEAALAGKANADVEVSRGRRPPLFDAGTGRALVAPVLATLFWTAAVLREGMAGQPLDPLALLLRLLALAFSLRALLLLAMLAARIRTWAQSGDFALALASEGLFVRTPRGDFAIPREDVIDVVEHGRWGERAGRRWSEVYVVTRPESGRLHLALPPVFDGTSGMLAERLMRWRGPASRPQPVETEAPALLVSRLWEELCSGARPPGVAVVRHGRGWLRQGPWATVLLGVAVLEGWARLPADASRAVGAGAPALAALCVLLAPLGWALWTRREIAHRRGIALVFTPHELLLRTRAGVQRFPWPDVTRIDLDTRRAWSMLYGAHESRSLVFRRKTDGPIVVGEMILDVPAEVALSLADAYRKARRSDPITSNPTP